MSHLADRMDFKDCITDLIQFSAIIILTMFMVTSPTQSRRFPFTLSFHTTSWQHLIFLQEALYFIYIFLLVVLLCCQCFDLCTLQYFTSLSCFLLYSYRPVYFLCSVTPQKLDTVCLFQPKADAKSSDVTHCETCLIPFNT